MKALHVLLEGRVAGIVEQSGGRLSFRYEDSWRGDGRAYPLSLSMPLAAREHAHAVVHSHLWGLLPDNELILERWGRRFQVSARNPFALLSHVGEDCPGAVQLVREDRLERLLAQGGEGELEPLTEAEIAERLRRLQSDAAAWRIARDTGQFSLAGSQPKTALHFDGKRWGIPEGRLPTTHILKPPTGDLDGLVVNEHLCLRLAQALGLPACQSEVMHFGDVPAIVIERHDRVRLPEAGGRTAILRIHQEDLCQALGVHPAIKYQSEGGPGPRETVNLLRETARGGEGSDQHQPAAQEDIGIFVRALIFNWLIGGTDAHAKNYSLLLGSGGFVRLAPLYDLASIFAHPELQSPRAKLAMKIGGEYRLERIRLSHWQALARDLRLEEEMVAERVRTMAAALPDALQTAVNETRAGGVDHPVAVRLLDALSRRALRCVDRT